MEEPSRKHSLRSMRVSYQVQRQMKFVMLGMSTGIVPDKSSCSTVVPDVGAFGGWVNVLVFKCPKPVMCLVDG